MREADAKRLLKTVCSLVPPLCSKSAVQTAASSRMFKKSIQRGRSEREAEAYPCGTLRIGATREQSWWAFSTSC
jgi:hypothetical protein